MMYLSSVQQPLCGLFAKVHSNTTGIKKIGNLKLFYLFFINKRSNVVSNNYWSSTTNASDSSNAWNVNFGNGNDNWNNKSNNYYVRCVRDND